jgi:hypothetical protein
MKVRTMLAAAAIGTTLAISAAGAMEAHWHYDRIGPGMGPGMMDPERDVFPSDDRHLPARGVYPDDWWDWPDIVLMPPHR